MTFGELLRDWRSRRRFSQLELALEAEISARHVSFLETGRSHPSRDMVMILAETLQVPRAERNALLQAAGFARLYVARDWQSDDLAFVRGAMSQMLENHDPYPAFALDRHWHLVKMNAGAERLLSAVDLGIGDSLLKAVVSSESLAHAIENLDEVRRHLRARLRAESLHLGGDPILDRAVGALSLLLTDTTEPTDALPVIVPVTFCLEDLRLSFFTLLAHFGATEDIALAELKLELMFPADAPTQSHLQT